MTEPLILLVHQRVLPGGQLTHPLQENGFRTQTVADGAQLVNQCLQDKPLLVIVDLAVNTHIVRRAIAELRENPATSHIPVIVYAPGSNEDLMEPENNPGATLTVSDGALLLHLDQLLDQALQLE